MIKHGDVVRLKKYLGGNDLLREGDLLEVATLTDETLVCVAIDGYAKDSMVARNEDIEGVKNIVRAIELYK